MRKRQVDKTDKKKEDYEFEKQQKECTFAPKIYSKQPKYLKDKVQSKIASQSEATTTAEPNQPAVMQQSTRERQALYE